jgi:hypothetical protein
MRIIIFVIVLIFTNVSYSFTDSNYINKEKQIDSCGFFYGFWIVDVYPQPFGFVTNYRFQIPDSSTVKIFVMNITSDTLIILFDGFLEKGIYTVGWNRLDKNKNKVKSGLYFLVFDAELRRNKEYNVDMSFRGVLNIIIVN